ncbi:hypothetical protein ES703_89705 [subsurface metagenome]
MKRLLMFGVTQKRLFGPLALSDISYHLDGSCLTVGVKEGRGGYLVVPAVSNEQLRRVRCIGLYRLYHGARFAGLAPLHKSLIAKFAS